MRNMLFTSDDQRLLLKLLEIDWHDYIISARNPEDYKERYHEYLESDEWYDIRRQVFERDNFKCQSCCSPTNLTAHHLTYIRIGCEELDDLETLCWDCHERYH